MSKYLLALASSLLLLSAEARHPYRNPVGKEFPILAWYSIRPESEQTKERYQELHEAGFNISFTHFGRVEEVEKGLEACKGTGVKIMVTTLDFEANASTVVSKLKSHPMVAGWFLRDEPVAKDFAGLRNFKDRIWEQDTTHMLYLNLLPNYVPSKNLGTHSYKEYLQRFVDEIDLGFFSFDNYPVIVTEKKDTLLRDLFYSNLEDALATSKETGEPFWAFALSTAHDPYPVATREMLRLEVFSNLAYGAQGIQYFTYWNPGNTGTWNFNTAPISLDGHRTHVYYLVKELNQEIKRLTPVFLGASIIDAAHIGTDIPKGTHRPSSLPFPFQEINTDGPGLLVSHFRNNKKTYLMVVNRDLHHRQTVTVRKNGKVTRIKNGDSFTDHTKESRFLLNPGDYLLYKL